MADVLALNNKYFVADLAVRTSLLGKQLVAKHLFGKASDLLGTMHCNQMLNRL